MLALTLFITAEMLVDSTEASNSTMKPFSCRQLSWPAADRSFFKQLSENCSMLTCGAVLAFIVLFIRGVMKVAVSAKSKTKTVREGRAEALVKTEPKYFCAKLENLSSTSAVVKTTITKMAFCRPKIE